MGEELEIDLFQAAMEANNLEYQEVENKLLITKGKKKKGSIQTLLIISIIVFVIAIYVLLFVSTRAGIFVFGLAGSFFFGYVTLNQKEQNAQNRVIEIDDEQIRVKDGFKVKTINLGDISEFKRTVKRTGNHYVGNIAIITERGMSYEFLEIVGDKEDLIQDDLAIISNHIIDNYINDDQE